MNETKLDRSPSISSCFPERCSGPPQMPLTTQLGHTLPLPLPRPPSPQISVDKHPLPVEDLVSPKELGSSAASTSRQLRRTLTSVDLADDAKTSVSAPATFRGHEQTSAMPSPEPLPVLPLPLPKLLKRNRSNTSLSLYAPLYHAAMKGDWGKAEEFLKSHPGSINVRITKEMDTLLHIAAGAKHIKFVEEVVKLITAADVALRNKYNNTALCYAAASGMTRMAEMMVGKNPSLPMMRNNKGVTPLYVAALFGHRDMVWYLYSVTSVEYLTDEDYVSLLVATISNDLFDVALSIIRCRPDLAVHRDPDGNTALHVLARKPSAFASKSELKFWQKFIYPWIFVEVPTKCCCPSNVSKIHGHHINQESLSFLGQLFHVTQLIVPGMKVAHEKKTMHEQTLAIVKLCWDQVLLLDDSQITELLTSPSQPLFDAAEFGVIELIIELLRKYPDLVWKLNEESRSIFHVAVMHRQEKVFNLIHDIGAHKDMIASYKDNNHRNILHLAAAIAPLHQLNMISGAALQMQRELLWFKEVEKNVQPSLKNMRDKQGRTPRMLFTEEHKGLVKEGENWMKNTASSCMLLATLITTVMFAAIFTVPGGNDNTKGTPIFLESKSFVIFAMADALALFSSVTSILMFLSILTSRYAEEDFLKSLPKRLVIGLATLFCSIASMLISFGATFCIVVGHRLAWIVIPIALSCSVPITLFAFLQFPLFADMMHSTYGTGVFARKSIDMLY